MRSKTLQGGSGAATPASDSFPILAELARLCVLARLPEETAIATIRAAYRGQESADQPVPTGFVDSFDASQVLSIWHEHARFLADDGTPAPLHISLGQFSELCQAAAINSSADEVLALLVASSAVRRENDTVTVTRRHLIVGENEPIGVTRAVRMVLGLLSTMNHNLTRGADEPGRFERSVASHRLPQKQVPALLAYLGIHGQSFLEDLDSWMSVRESSDASGTIGVGVYLFIEPDSAGESSQPASRLRWEPDESTK